MPLGGEVDLPELLVREYFPAREQHHLRSGCLELVEDAVGLLQRHDVLALGARRDVTVHALEVAGGDDLDIRLDRDPLTPRSLDHALTHGRGGDLWNRRHTVVPRDSTAFRDAS